MQQQREYVGIDLHRRRSVIVRRSADGETKATYKIDNSARALANVIAEAGPNPEVVLEATYGWYWAADVLAAEGASVHLAHPLGNNWGHRRVKNDERDATDLADLLRLGRLAESWVAPPEVRELRELVRYRHRLVEMRSSLKAQAHAVLAKEGVAVPMSDLFGVAGRELLAACSLAKAYATRVGSLRELVDVLSEEVASLDHQIATELKGDRGYQAVQAIPGVGPVLAAVFVAEVGDPHRFGGPDKLCRWAGLTPRHHESDTTVHRGRITKQGSRLVRWAAVEAAQRTRGASFLQAHRHRVADRRGKGIAKVATARKIVSLVFYGLRDGEVRCLAEVG